MVQEHNVSYIKSNNETIQNRQNTAEEDRKDDYYYVLPVEHVPRGF